MNFFNRVMDAIGIPGYAPSCDAPRVTIVRVAAPKTPHKCPVCDGAGVVSRPPGITADQLDFSSSCGPWPCQTCKGTTLIWSE